MGKMADGIVAQAIGGGGGKGGAASTASSADISGNIAVGGSGGGSNSANANNGGRATVTNSGRVYTMGALSTGILAQSIAGGGGSGGSSSATSGTSENDRSVTLNVSVGGGGGSGSDSFPSQVTSSGLIETRGHDSIGIIAQSIAGGGGVVKTLATDLDNEGGSAAASSKDFAANIKIGNSAPSASGVSGFVAVTTQKGGTIATSGDDRYGILAQSIAGGGGVALGGKPIGSSASDFFGSGTMLGNVNLGDSPDPDDNQGVHVEVGDAITTAGKGGVGVFAQSIGGGGGISGDIGWTMQKTTMGRDGNHVGNGGDINITADQGASITTASDNAPGIIAQSIGGGGGWFANKGGAYIGSAGGVGNGSPVSVDIQGSIDAQGPASAGIFAQSVGGSSNGGGGGGSAITITIGSADNKSASVIGGNGFDDDAAAVYIDHGSIETAQSSANSLVNYGTIDSHENDPSTGDYKGTAIYGTGGYTYVTNFGTINGQIHLGTQQGNDFTYGQVINESGGVINSGTEISLGAGTLTNNGKLSIGGDGHIGATTLMGNYVQGPSGVLQVDGDPSQGSADLLKVTGNADVAGTIKVVSPTLSRTPLTVLQAGGSLTLDPSFLASGSHVLSYAPSIVGNTLQVTQQADFLGPRGALEGNRQAVAGHLQQLYDSEAPGFAEGLAALAGDDKAGRYEERLDSVSGQTLAALGGLQMQASSSFLAGLNSCPTFEGKGTLMQEWDCAWGRITGGYTDQNGSGTDMGYDVKALTTQMGAQKEIADGWFLGGSLAYDLSALDSDHDLTSIDGNGVMAGAILKRQTGPLLLSAAVDAGYGWYDSKRDIDLATGTEQAKASPKAGNVGLHARAAYEVPFDRWYVRPSLDVGGDYVRTDSFDEHGASPFNLDVSSEDNVIFSATPTVELGARVDLANGSTLRPHLDLGFTAASANNWKPDARFTGEGGGNGYQIESRNPNLIGHLGIGIDMATVGAVDVTLQYGLDVASGYTANSGALRVNYRF